MPASIIAQMICKLLNDCLIIVSVTLSEVSLSVGDNLLCDLQIFLAYLIKSASAAFVAIFLSAILSLLILLSLSRLFAFRSECFDRSFLLDSFFTELLGWFFTARLGLWSLWFSKGSEGLVVDFDVIVCCVKRPQSAVIL